MFSRLITTLLWAVLATNAWGQGSILQGGPWTPGQVPMYVGQGSSQAIVQTSGPAGGGAVGVGIRELGLTARGTGTAPYVGQGTGEYGSIFCMRDAPITNATGYHFLCLSPNSSISGGLISYGAGGGASDLPLKLNINGTVYEFPFAITGIVGPPSTVVGDVVVWNNTTGTLVSDTGLPYISIVKGPASAVSGNVPSFNGTSGKIIQDSGVIAASIVTGPASATSGNIASFNGSTGKLVLDSGVAVASVVVGPSSVVSGNLASFNGTTGKLIADAGITATGLANSIAPQAVRTRPTPFNTNQATASGFYPGMVFPIAVDGYGIGRVTPSRTPEQAFFSILARIYAQQTQVVAWVDPVNGNDSWTCLSQTFISGSIGPCKTFSFAMTTSTAFVVNLLPGTHTPADFNVATALYPYKYVRAPFGDVVFKTPGQNISALTWTATGGYAGVYQTTLTLSGLASVQRILRTDVIDSLGYPSRMPFYPNVASLQVAGSGWTISGTTLFMAFFGLSVETNKTKFEALYVDANGNSRVAVIGGLYAYFGPGIDFRGVQLYGVNSGGTGPSLFADGVRVLFAPGNGFQCDGSYCYFGRSTSYANVADGFHYQPNASNSTQGIFVEWDVVSMNAGDVDTFGTGITPNNQGSTAEIGSSGVRMGGLYRYNWGQGIADVGGSGLGYADATWIIGADTLSQRYTTAPGSTGVHIAGNAGSGSRTAWIDTSTAIGESFPFLVSGASGATITLNYFNLQPTTVPISQVGGVVATYNPTAP